MSYVAVIRIIALRKLMIFFFIIDGIPGIPENAEKNLGILILDRDWKL